jgi:hypothetical protein
MRNPHSKTMDELIADAEKIASSHNIQQTDCYTMLPPDVTLRDIKEIRNYFGEHDATCFEHRAFSILSRLINHLEISGGNIV